MYIKIGDTMKRRRFKAKRKRNINIVAIMKVAIIVFIIFIFFRGCASSILKFQLYSSNQEFIKSLLYDSNHYLKYEKENQNFLNRMMMSLVSIDFSLPVTLLWHSLGYKGENSHFETSSDEQATSLNIKNYIPDPNPVNVDNPIVYIYNSHQLEDYSSNNFLEYNITPNVMMASYMLKEKLNALGISTIVETSNITDFLNVNGWSYSYSYKASRFYILDAINKYPSLKLFIDIHRDSIPKSSSTVSINGKNYAKVLFVVGLDYEGYEANLELANTIDGKLKKIYPTISRGVMEKTGANVNGIYNQDLKNGMLLIELGGNENTIEEIMNTIEILSKFLSEYLGENNG